MQYELLNNLCHRDAPFKLLTNLKNCSRSKRQTKIDNLETEEKYLLITSSEKQFNHKKIKG